MNGSSNPFPMKAFLGTPLLLLCALLISSSATAQLSEHSKVSLITIYPGKSVYALWGHSALRIYDPTAEIDIAYNYGTFDFGSPLIFMGKFAYGKLDYSLSRQHYSAVVADAKYTQNRTVVEQHLRLGLNQRNALFTFVEHNALPEHRTYRYDFLRDNCSTRIRDLLTDVLGLSMPTGVDSPQSIRAMLGPYAAHKSFLHLGTNIGMGLPVDRAVTDRTFLPLELMDVIAAMRSDTAQLVFQTDTLHMSRTPTPPAMPWAELWAFLVLGVGVWVTLRGAAASQQIFDRSFYMLLGLAGLLIAFFWLVSAHTVTHPNLHALWLLPTHLVIAWLPEKTVWIKWYHAVAAVLAIFFILLLVAISRGVPWATIPLAMTVVVRSGSIGRSVFLHT